MKTFFAAAIAGLASASPVPHLYNTNGWASLDIKEDGQSKTVYIAAPNWFSGEGGDHISIPEGGRVYLSNSPSLDPNNFYKPALLGGIVEYDVDMSQIECGCIAAFYLVRTPAKGWGGSLDKTDGFYYCDANQVGGEYCPEFDIMEANKYAYQTTTHSCNAPNDGHYDYCNRGGTCVTNTVEQWNHQGIMNYGPGGQYKINTTQEFHVKLEFKVDGSNNFSAFETTLTQGGNSVSIGCSDYSANVGMTGDLDDMAFAISNWSGDASWLWKDACGGSCGSPTLVYKNISITTGKPGPGPTPPTPGNWTYGDACASKDNDYCDGSCDCRWSWPTSDPAQWASKDAACRCKA